MTNYLDKLKKVGVGSTVYIKSVVCVHDEPEKECGICEPIQKERNGEYYLEEYKHLIRTKLK